MTATVSNNSLVVQGDLNIYTANKLFNNTAQEWVNVQTIDLSNAGQVDSIGLALVVYWQQQIRKSGGTGDLHAVPEKLTELASLYDLQESS